MNGDGPDLRDRYWMGQALALAALAEGSTRPNPMVGAVIVRDGRAVGCGYHRRAGRDHAEVEAIREAADAARGGTLYVNLEPCIHHGRTPPCADAIRAAGIRRVVAAVRDPNPRVAGGGLNRLREAGIEVQEGILGDEARRLNGSFLGLWPTGRPMVTLKAAMSTDGRISARDGCSAWITGARSRVFAHRLRFAHDAVLIGAGTARTDDPGLNPRLAGLTPPEAGEPLRVVLSRTLKLPRELRLFRRPRPGAARVRIYTGPGACPDPPPHSEVRKVPLEAEGGLDLGAVLDDLGRSGIASVLVEGGAGTFAGFLRADLVDRFALFSAPVLLGSGGGTPLLDVQAVPSPAEGWRLIPERRFALGRDLLTTGMPGGGAKCSPA